MKKSKNKKKDEMIIRSKLKIPEEIKEKMKLEISINQVCRRLPSDFPDPFVVQEIEKIMVDTSGFLNNEIKNFFSPIITNLLPNKTEDNFLFIDGYLVFRRAPSENNFFVFLLRNLEYLLYHSYTDKNPILHIAL